MGTPVTIEALASQIEHQRETLSEVKADMKQILAAIPGLASRDEVTTLRQAQATQDGEIRAMAVRLRAVEDDRTAARAVLAVAGVFGLGGVGALLKWLLSAP